MAEQVVAPPTFSDGNGCLPRNDTPREGANGKLNFYELQTSENGSETLENWYEKLGAFLAAYRADPRSVVDEAGNCTVARNKVKDAPKLTHFPTGYQLFQQLFTPVGRNGRPQSVHHDPISGLDNVRRDAYLIGFPTGPGVRFRSPAEFAPHLVWLEEVSKGTYAANDKTKCFCRLCKTKPASPVATPAPAVRPPQPVAPQAAPVRPRTPNGAAPALALPAVQRPLVPVKKEVVKDKDKDIRKTALDNAMKTKRKDREEKSLSSRKGSSSDEDEVPLAKRKKTPPGAVPVPRSGSVPPPKQSKSDPSPRSSSIGPVPRQSSSAPTLPVKKAATQNEGRANLPKFKKPKLWRKLGLATGGNFAKSDMVLVPVRVKDANAVEFKQVEITFDQEANPKHIWWPASIDKVIKKKPNNTPKDAKPEDIDYTYSYRVILSCVDPAEAVFTFEEPHIRPWLFRVKSRAGFDGTRPEEEQINSPAHRAYERAMREAKETLDFKIHDLTLVKQQVKENGESAAQERTPDTVHDLAIVWGPEMIKVGCAVRLPNQEVLVIERASAKTASSGKIRSAKLGGTLWSRKENESGKGALTKVGEKEITVPSKDLLGRFYCFFAGDTSLFRPWSAPGKVETVDLTDGALEMPKTTTQVARQGFVKPEPTTDSVVVPLSPPPSQRDSSEESAHIETPQYPSPPRRVKDEPVEVIDEEGSEVVSADVDMNEPEGEGASSPVAEEQQEGPVDDLLSMVTGTFDDTPAVPPPVPYLREGVLDPLISVIVDSPPPTAFVLKIEEEATENFESFAKLVVKGLNEAGIATPRLTAIVNEGRALTVADLNMRYVSSQGEEMSITSPKYTDPEEEGVEPDVLFLDDLIVDATILKVWAT